MVAVVLGLEVGWRRLCEVRISLGEQGPATRSLICGRQGLRWLTIICIGDHGGGFLRCVSFYLLIVGVHFSVEAHDKEATYSNRHAGYSCDGRSRNLVYG